MKVYFHLLSCVQYIHDTLFLLATPIHYIIVYSTEPVIQFSSMEYVLQGEQGPVFVGFVMSPPTIGPLLMTLRLVSGTAISELKIITCSV